MTPATSTSTVSATGIPIRALAHVNTSREVLQLMLAIKNILIDYGISIHVTSPDAYAQLLLSGDAIINAELQDLRRRLREVEPPNTCVYQFTQAEGQLTCARCRQVLTLHIPAEATLSSPLTTQCPTCHMPFAVAIG